MRLLIITVLLMCACVGSSGASSIGVSIGANINYARNKLVDLIHNLSMLPASNDFGDVATNTTATQVFTLSNTGNYAAEDVAITVTGTGFTEQSRTCAANPFDLASDADCTVTALFSPTAAQTYNGFVNYSAPNIAKVSAGLSGEGLSYIAQWTFEEAGLPTSWTNSTGVADYDYATSPAPLQGTQSMYLASGAKTIYSATFAAQTDVYASTMFSISSNPVMSTQVFEIVDGSNNLLCYSMLSNTGAIRPVLTGATDNGSSVSLSPNTTYYLMLHYVASNSCSLYVTTNPFSWGTASTKTGGTASASTVKLRFRNYNENNMNSLYDDVRVSSSSINYP